VTSETKEAEVNSGFSRHRGRGVPKSRGPAQIRTSIKTRRGLIRGVRVRLHIYAAVTKPALACLNVVGRGTMTHLCGG